MELPKIDMVKVRQAVKNYGPKPLKEPRVRLRQPQDVSRRRVKYLNGGNPFDPYTSP